MEGVKASGRMPKNAPICNMREHMMYLLSSMLLSVSSKEVGSEMFIELTGVADLTDILTSLQSFVGGIVTFAAAVAEVLMVDLCGIVGT
jgi:hypothetical protein